MMKKLLLFIVLCYSFTLIAQVTNEGEPASWKLIAYNNIDAISLPKVDIQKLRAEDDLNVKTQIKPFRIGVQHNVNVGLKNAGIWTRLPNGDRIWRVLFNSKDAVHLSVVFDKFYIPKGGKVYLYNKDRTDLLGAYTETQNNKEETLGSWLVNGDELWIEYYEPKEAKNRGKLNLSTIIHGYRLGHTYQKGYLDSIEEKALNDSGDCNHDVDCPIGTDFEAHKNVLKRAVAFLNMGNGFICSGALVNNTAQDKKPYFLTANHCFTDDEGVASNPAAYSFRFKWISPDPVCAATTNSTNGPTNFTISGSTLRARNANTDFMLVEINSAIPSDWDLTYAGWDKSDIDPTFEVGIHHPSGDIMKVCRDDTGAIKQVNNGAQTWEVTTVGGGWELGVTEGGSSGSPLFDHNGRVIGQLFGGGAACLGIFDNGAFDFYGRFGISWDAGGTAPTQLKDWLDPQNSNQNTLNTLENVLAVNDEFLEKNITLFPNPTTGIIQINATGLVGNLSYEVYNMLGQNIKSNELQNNKILNISDLTNSIYFIKIIEIDTNRSLVKKIVLNK